MTSHDKRRLRSISALSLVLASVLLLSQCSGDDGGTEAPPPAPGPEYGTMSDIDGNVYRTVKIGDQWWMEENLKVTHYRNGDEINDIVADNDWQFTTEGGYCAYYHADSNKVKYGLLYNWYAVNDPRGLAPDGWHVPSDEEWKQLEMYLGMSRASVDSQGWRGKDAGLKLKSTSGWRLPDWNGTNESGFNALPAGARSFDGPWLQDIGRDAWFWTSTGHSAGGTGGWMRRLYLDYSRIEREPDYATFGMSVRLVKD